MSRSLWLLLGMLLAAPAARAQFDYRRTVVPGKPLCLAWPIREYVYHLDAAGSLWTPGDTELTAIEAAFDSWRALAAGCTDYVFTRGPDVTNPSVGYDQSHPELNQNVITFRERPCFEVVPENDVCKEDDSCGNAYACWEHGFATIALTTTTFSFNTGYALDADIELNAAQAGGGPGFLFTTVSSPPCLGEILPECVATDVQNTMTHEIGHVVGLDHVYSLLSTMEATAPAGETHKRVIDVGSGAGFCRTYPRGLPPAQCGEPVVTNKQLSAQSTGTGCAAAPGPWWGGVWLGAWGAMALRRRARRRIRGQGSL
ncbi:myxosortase-dependent metalloprotease, MXAN_2677/MXAN_2678 family [Stigmatella aurantiaca]|uniref:Conserved uncharacterized protein n=1 Tax=Stigmatella aurantiaca (strain DW4/3-1) TaxID=378806 RepID=E3G002_STIAD|nr:myxosortase-dependent metalloprotease, MXAN_2677/MXAN_2678 family [Stigmatella aurantiaca]ADO71205.1 conserved uncharacterized protein [Stigmatella aurantiaca DW4/3-1]